MPPIIFTFFSALLSFIYAGKYSYALARSLTMQTTDNPILDPILSFFSAIWAGLTTLWNGLVNAIVSWFSAVWNYTYQGIPIGPVLFMGILVLVFLMLYGFFLFKEKFLEG